MPLPSTILSAAPPVHDAACRDDLPPTIVYKDDSRSRVWRSVTPEGEARVVKLFKGWGLSERIKWMVGLHPAQRERRWHERLAEAGLPTAPILDGGIADGEGVWLATPAFGLSLFNWLANCDPDDDRAQRHELTRALGRITGRLLQLGIRHRDFKASNLVLRAERSSSPLVMIDAGACRGVKGTPLLAVALGMLHTLYDNLLTASSHHRDPASVAISRSDRLRFYRAMASVWNRPPDGLQHLLRSAEFAEAKQEKSRSRKQKI